MSPCSTSRSTRTAALPARSYQALGASVNAADAYVFVTPEYNFGPPPPLLNALNYVYKEWNYKPAGIVSYGGVSGGVRSALVEKIT